MDNTTRPKVTHEVHCKGCDTVWRTYAEVGRCIACGSTAVHVRAL